MTRDDILNMAREAGLNPRMNNPGEWRGYTDNITRFAALVAAAPQAEPVAYGMGDTQLGRGHRLMMVRLDKGQDGCTIPLYTHPAPAAAMKGAVHE